MAIMLLVESSHGGEWTWSELGDANKPSFASYFDGGDAEGKWVSKGEAFRCR